MLELAKTAVESFKTLNEARVEQGLPEIDLSKTKNPADVPLNPQAVQMFQAAQQGGGAGGGMEDPEGGEGFADDGDAPDAGGGEADDGAWGEIKDAHGGDAVEKSFIKNKTIRICV